MKKAIIAIALALTGCGADYTEVTEDGAEDPLTREEYLEQLQAQAPEGVEVSYAEPGEMPAYSDLSFTAEGAEPVPIKHYNDDGSEWVPPRTVQKGRFDCPSIGGICPCFSALSPGLTDPNVDGYGNFVPANGVCAFPDNGQVTWAAVTRRFMSDIGNFGEFIPLTSIGSVFGPAFSAQIDDQAFPTGYSLGWRNPAPQWPGRPAGWNSLQLESVTPFPTNPQLYPTNTDIVFRLERFEGDGSFYDTEPPKTFGTLAYTRFFYSSSAGSAYSGVNTDYGAKVVYRWRPTDGAGNTSPLITYWRISGVAITLDYQNIADQAARSSPGLQTWKEEMALRHTMCHEMGHAMGFGHDGPVGGTGCMKSQMPSDTSQWYNYWPGWANGLLTNARANDIPQFCNPLCETGGTGLNSDSCQTCKGAKRPPLPTLEF